MNQWRQERRASGVAAGEPCSPDRIAHAEATLGRSLPTDLVTLYRAGDGFFDESGQWHVIWPLHRVVDENSQAWADGRLRHDLLAFGDDGTGAPFCALLTETATANIVRWSWIDHDIEGDEQSFRAFVANWVGIRTWPPPIEA
jgi:cell wall assembly regulator SMI1